MKQSRCASLALLLLLACSLPEGGYAFKEASPGGAGYALLFHNNVIIKENFTDFPSTALTFEAWLSTSDLCHTGAIMSYAKRARAYEDDRQRTEDSNHFIIYDPGNVIACHDFEFIDMLPDMMHMSCHGHYNRTPDDYNPRTATFLSHSGAWHHLAVTWDGQNNGLMQIYQDGLLVAKAVTGKTDPLVSDGALMLGGEQDCYSGCTDPHQGYYGMMDEIRIWNRVRPQTEIINDMRRTHGSLTTTSGLVAHWTFDDLDSTHFTENGTTSDKSGKGNDLDLLKPPQRADEVIPGANGGIQQFKTGSLKFKNSYATSQQITKMPTRDITIEFWARTSLNNPNSTTSPNNEPVAEFLSYASSANRNHRAHVADSIFMDDALRIERYMTDYSHTQYLPHTDTSTVGSISVHINSNMQGNGKLAYNWVDFATGWTDGDWHHIAVTWTYNDGNVKLFFDGEERVAFWRASEGVMEDKDPSKGGVPSNIARGIERSATGSLVLGQNQECYGGCFSSGSGYDGSMANVRIWNVALSRGEIRANMFSNTVLDSEDLVMNYLFTKDGVTGVKDSERVVRDQQEPANDLWLGSVAPTYQFSYVPLTDKKEKPLKLPSPGSSGYAMKLHDEQVLIKENFDNFPTDAITVEFWMWSVDTCRQGVPFSYAHGAYQELDNAFLIFNYNNWGVSVMEDEGQPGDHEAGFGSTDGRWHHIAVTWESRTGDVFLYDDGRLSWHVQRAKGLKIPQGGTLVVGREQDCLGGCFDSMYGAIGDVQPVVDLEYGIQDFFGVIDEIRIWKIVRSQDDIVKGMTADRANAGKKGRNKFINTKDRNLVAYWKFDEGEGFIVKDETPHGNNLHILEKPDWMVMRWLSKCGDGQLEGAEECDDGNRKKGDGCDNKCRIERGYKCSATSPSRCYRSGSVGSATKNIAGVIVGVVVVVVVAVIAFMAYRKREVIYDHFPQVERMVLFSQDKINSAMGRRPGYAGVLSLDNGTDLSPHFVDSEPPVGYHPPAANPYTPLPEAKTGRD